MTIETMTEAETAEAKGYSATMRGTDRARTTWYRPDGLAIRNLPADPYHTGLYLGKGWSTTPPDNPVPSEETIVGNNTVAGPSGLERAVEMGVQVEPTANGIALPKPPKHMHVMHDEIGSPCLVLGCVGVRQNPRGTTSKAKKNART